MQVYQKHAGDDVKLLIKFHWPNAVITQLHGKVGVSSEHGLQGDN